MEEGKLIAGGTLRAEDLRVEVSRYGVPPHNGFTMTLIHLPTGATVTGGGSGMISELGAKSQLLVKLTEKVLQLEPVMSTFYVRWSAEDQEWVATASTYPSLSWLSLDPVEALEKLLELVREEEKPFGVVAGPEWTNTEDCL